MATTDHGIVFRGSIRSLDTFSFLFRPIDTLAEEYTLISLPGHIPIMVTEKKAI